MRNATVYIQENNHDNEDEIHTFPVNSTMPSSQNHAEEAVGLGARVLFDFFGFLAFFDLLAEA